ncbi:MAG: hypothetical protein OH340_01810, partial [Candidatus Parvarchaeota archaeon]|nr:hypothetical protein [Candidatus Rehaiarchaeum fermentans]
MSAVEYIVITGIIFAASALALSVSLIYFNSLLGSSLNNNVINFNSIVSQEDKFINNSFGLIVTLPTPPLNLTNAYYCKNILTYQTNYGTSFIELNNTNFFIPNSKIYYLSFVNYNGSILISSPGNQFLHVILLPSSSSLTVKIYSFNSSTLLPSSSFYTLMISNRTFSTSLEINTPSSHSFSLSPGNYNISISNSLGYMDFCYSF